MSKKTLEITSSLNSTGIKLRVKNKDYNLRYPKQIWSEFPLRLKEILLDNLTYLITVNIPFVSSFDSIEYNTSMPYFKPFFDNMVVENIPSAVNDYSDSTYGVIKKFLNTKYKFKDNQIKIPDYKMKLKEKAILPLSCGKDSLLSLGVCKEIGLKPVCVYINDTVSPKENRIKIKHCRSISREFRIPLYFVTNSIERINDFQTWNTKETCLGYMHMVTGFCFILLPFVHYYKAKYIILGNQKDMSFAFENKDGFITYPSPDQYPEWTSHQSSMVNLISGGAKVISLIEPLTNLAITRILHTRYRDLGRYEISCDSLDASYRDRWCHACSKCARISLFMHAFGIDPKDAGFEDSLLEEKHQKLYVLFRGREIDHYERSPEARDQQLLAFYMAYEKGVRGYLIDSFKKKYLPEAKRRKKELIKEFLSVYASDLPSSIKQRVLKIYKQELKNLG